MHDGDERIADGIFRATGLTLGQDHGHLLECPGVAKARKEEEHEHGGEEPGEFRGVFGIQVERSPAEGDCHANAADECPDCTTEFIAQRSPQCTYTSTDKRPKVGICRTGG